MTALSERVETLMRWARARVEVCRVEEEKFRLGTTKGPPQALVEAWTERRTLQAVLDMLDLDNL